MFLAVKRKRSKLTRTKDSQVLPWAQICKRYTSTWVLITNPKVDKWQKVQRGRVVAFGNDPDLLCEEAARLQLRDTGVLYTGVARNEKTAFLL